jgi:hypothetical protein
LISCHQTPKRRGVAGQGFADELGVVVHSSSTIWDADRGRKVPLPLGFAATGELPPGNSILPPAARTVKSLPSFHLRPKASECLEAKRMFTALVEVSRPDIFKFMHLLAMLV